MSQNTFYQYSQSQPVYSRLLNVDDKAVFDQFCLRNPFRSLTMKLNIDKFGFQSQITSSWGAFRGSDSELFGVMLHYGNTMIVIDRDGSSATEFTPIIDRTAGIAGIRATKESAVEIQALLRKYTPTDWEESFLMKLSIPPKIASETLSLARRASLSDLEPLAALYSTAGLMFRPHSNVKQKLTETRVFVVDDIELQADRNAKPRILACALLNVEGEDTGMIGGVYTLPYARGRGYASACTAALSIDLQTDGKTPVLFYENPKAGSVYRSLGFENAGRWGVIYVAPPEG